MKPCKTEIPFVVRVVAIIQQPIVIACCCFRTRAQRESWKKPTSFHCSQILDPDIPGSVVSNGTVTNNRASTGFFEAEVYVLDLL